MAESDRQTDRQGSHSADRQTDRQPGVSQCSQAPVGAGPLPGGAEDRQADEGDGGRDGEGADVPQQEARHPEEPHQHLQHAGHHDGSLDLEQVMWTSIHHPTCEYTSHPDGMISVSILLHLVLAFVLAFLCSIMCSIGGYLSDPGLPDVGGVEGKSPVPINLFCRREEKKQPITAQKSVPSIRHVEEEP